MLYSQDIYRLKYKSFAKKDTTTNEAFFSLSANGTGSVRIRPSNDTNLVVEMKFEEAYASDKDGNPDNTMMVYKGTGPAVVRGNKTFIADSVTFWFKKNSNNFYDPWAVTPASVNTVPADSNFLSAEFISSSDILKRKDFVSGFFADTSIYYNNLFGPKSKGGMLSADEKKNTQIFLVVVASTNDTTLQPNCMNDAKNFIAVFTDIGKNILALLPRNIHIDTIFGNNYSRENIELALGKIHPNPNDIVIFYYSGHGFHKKKYGDSRDKQFPYFDLRDPTKQKFYKDLETKTLNVQDIYDTIVKKGARLNLVLSDCCNDTVAAPKKKALEIPKKKGITRYTFDNVRTLFMNQQPMNLLMTAADVNEEAIVTPSFNSYFTYFFLQSLTTYLGPEKKSVAWPLILSDAQISTIRQVMGLCKGITNCPNKQTPKLFLPGIK
jgi:hypothetical protein